MRVGVLLAVVMMLQGVVATVTLAESGRPSKHFVILLPVDINQADAETLSRVMEGVGPKKAQAIIDYRNQHGPFHSIDELTQVKGIGVGTLSRNRGRIAVIK